MSQGYLLDTNIPSEFSRPTPDARVTTWVVGQDALYLSVISIAEVRRGIYLLPPGKRRTDLYVWFEHYLPLFNKKTLPVTEAVASRWARMSALRQQIGIPLSVTDGLIAATAFEHGLTLATRNTKDFIDLGVPLLNPWEY